MHVVTISATYGAGGSVIGPAVAERLGVPFLDRAIPTAVADELEIGLDEALVRDEHVQGWLERWLAPMSVGMIGADLPHGALLSDERVVTCTQEAIRRFVTDTGGVILGRAGAFVLRDHPNALHVRLDGDPERRVQQATAILHVSEREARSAQARNDRARAAYVRRFYRDDPARPEHYHLSLDSTRLPHELCIDMIVRAAEAI